MGFIFHSEMLSLRGFWRRHKRKVLYAAGFLGSGYLLYKLYDANQRRLYDMDREIANELENDQLIKEQMQAHFGSIQKIADTMTLPHAMDYLSAQIAKELNLSYLTDRLQKGRGQSSILTYSEKHELWDQLKILSFTRMTLSAWAMTVLSLHIKVQVNILGSHLYIDTARGLGDSNSIEATEPVDSHDQQMFLATADFLANNGLSALISNMQAAAAAVLNGKQLRDSFNNTTLHETIVQMMDMFMSMGRPFPWLDYLMPKENRHGEASSNGDVSRFDQLMAQTQTVLSSEEFGNVVEISLKSLLDALMVDIETQLGDSKLLLGLPLARLLPKVAQMGTWLFDEPNRNRYIRIIGNVPQVESFFTLLYASVPTA